MAQLVITKTYQDGETPTQLDLDNIADSIEGFINVTKLGPDNIADNSIDASLVFVPGSITSDKIANAAVTTDKIVDGAVTSDKIAHGAITTAKIVDGAVTTAKIADGAITPDKIADGAVTADKKPDNAGGSTGTSFAVGNSGYYTNPSQLSISDAERPLMFVLGGSSFSLATSGTAISPANFEVYVSNNLSGRIRLIRGADTRTEHSLDLGGFYSDIGTPSPGAAMVQIPSSCIKSLDLSFASGGRTFTNSFRNTSSTSQPGEYFVVTSAGGLNAKELI